MKIIYIAFILMLAQIIFAQITPPHIQDAKRCDNWGMGYASFNNPNTGRTNIKFSQMQQNWNNSYVDFWETNTHISDTLGNLLFYSNGIMIADTTHHIMMGCDTLNPGYWSSPSRTQYGYEIHQSIITLPMPNHPNLYYVFHSRIMEPPNGSAIAEGLYYTVVDMNGNNGLGAVVSLRNPIIVNDSLCPRISACRHANGRDWWVLIKKIETDAYATVLLTPQGVGNLVWHNVLVPPNNFTKNYYQGQYCFSPDGTKFANHHSLFNDGNFITLYDFDRCTGVLSNPKFGFFNDSTATAGLAFSPNSHYLYFNTLKRLFQVDVDLTNPFSASTLIGVYDGFIGTFNIHTFFYVAQLADNGKIYLNIAGTSKYLHEIEQPNLPGSACLFKQHNVPLLTFNGFSMVNQAYFALGPLDGSPCDTLGIDNVPTYTQKPQEIKQIKVFPNPVNDYFTIETENIKGNAYLYNALGQLVKQMPINDNRTIFSTNNIPNGIYFFSVANASSRYTYAIKKLIIQHE